MSIIQAIAKQFGYAKVQASGQMWTDMSAGVMQSSGTVVTNTTAMRASAVMACVRVLADTVAQVPLVLYRRTGTGKERATDHPLHKVMNRPNRQQTGFDWRQMLQGHVALRGNAYCAKFYDKDQYASELMPLSPDRMRVEHLDGTVKLYKYRIEGGQEATYQPEQIIHLRGLSTDGVMGLNPIEHAAQQIGIALAADKFGAQFFGNGAQTTGILKHPGNLSTNAKKNLEDSLQRRIGGDNTMRPFVIEEGMEYQQLTIAPEQAQFLETRKFTVTDIARIFRVPPHMVGDLERATFSNIEQQSLSFVTYTMMPWFVMWEKRLTADLLDERDQEEYFFEFLVDGLLRGDAAARAAACQIQFMNGALTNDEWRAMENRDPLPDGLGERHYRPANLIEIQDSEPLPAVQQQPPRESDGTINRLLQDAAQRISSAEIRERAKGGYTRDSIASYATRVLSPFGLTWCDCMAIEGEGVDDYAARLCIKLREQYYDNKCPG